MSKKSKKVCVVMQCIATYRVPILKRLLQEFDRMEVYFGEKTKSPGLNLVTSRLLEQHFEGGLSKRIKKISNIWMGSILWQSGVVWSVVQRKFDVVVLDGSPFYLSNWPILILGRIFRVRVGLWGHGSRRPLKGLRGLVARIFYSLGDFILLYGNRGKSHLNDIGIEEKKMYPMRNSLAIVDSVNSGRQSIMVRENRNCLRLVFVGRILSNRGLETLFRAVANFKAGGRKVELRLVGNGDSDLVDRMCDLCHRVGIAKDVRFEGAIFDEELIASIFRWADLHVFPGDCGLSCIHAMAYGIPTITHDDNTSQKPEAESVIDGLTGFFFSKGDHLSLADSLLRFSSLSASETVAMSRNCREIAVNNYGVERQVKVVRNALDRVSPEGWEVRGCGSSGSF